jgi:hypothetical protein
MGYRFAAAAAQSQLATIMAAGGREDDAVRVRSRADAVFAQMTDVFRDALLDLLLLAESSPTNGVEGSTGSAAAHGTGLPA